MRKRLMRFQKVPIVENALAEENEKGIVTVN